MKNSALLLDGICFLLMHACLYVCMYGSNSDFKIFRIQVSFGIATLFHSRDIMRIVLFASLGPIRGFIWAMQQHNQLKINEMFINDMEKQRHKLTHKSQHKNVVSTKQSRVILKKTFFDHSKLIKSSSKLTLDLYFSVRRMAQ